MTTTSTRTPFMGGLTSWNDNIGNEFHYYDPFCCACGGQEKASSAGGKGGGGGCGHGGGCNCFITNLVKQAITSPTGLVTTPTAGVVAGTSGTCTNCTVGGGGTTKVPGPAVTTFPVAPGLATYSYTPGTTTTTSGVLNQLNMPVGSTTQLPYAAGTTPTVSHLMDAGTPPHAPEFVPAANAAQSALAQQYLNAGIQPTTILEETCLQPVICKFYHSTPSATPSLEGIGASYYQPNGVPYNCIDAINGFSPYVMDQNVYEGCQCKGGGCSNGSCPSYPCKYYNGVFLITIQPAIGAKEKAKGPWVLACNGIRNRHIKLSRARRYYFKYLPKCVKIDGEWVNCSNIPDDFNNSLVLSEEPTGGPISLSEAVPDTTTIPLFDLKWFRMPRQSDDVFYIVSDKFPGTRITVTTTDENTGFSY